MSLCLEKCIHYYFHCSSNNPLNHESMTRPSADNVVTHLCFAFVAAYKHSTNANPDHRPPLDSTEKTVGSDGRLQDGRRSCVHRGIILISASVLKADIRKSVFLTNKKYKNQECYRIMALIGVVQLLVTPACFMFGYMSIFNVDPFHIGSFTIKLFSASIRLDVLLGFVLALNRLRIMAELNLPAATTKVLIGISFFYGAYTFLAVLSPYCGYTALPGHYFPEYDYTRPYTWLLTKSNAIILIGTCSMTFLIYILLFFFMVRLHYKTDKFAINHKEANVLLYAVTRFSIDVSLLAINYIIEMPQIRWVHFLIGQTYMFSSLLLSPVIYLLFTNVRYDFCPALRRRISVASRVQSAVPESPKIENIRNFHR
uniref:Serpentine Receptor, class T n=1 Tax=Steinernema glaseri TaxID=37863 RepID=A0A1I7ZBU8_9BILA